MIVLAFKRHEPKITKFTYPGLLQEWHNVLKEASGRLKSTWKRKLEKYGKDFLNGLEKQNLKQERGLILSRRRNWYINRRWKVEAFNFYFYFIQ